VVAQRGGITSATLHPYQQDHLHALEPSGALPSSPDLGQRTPPPRSPGRRVWARHPRPSFHAESAARRSRACDPARAATGGRDDLPRRRSGTHWDLGRILRKGVITPVELSTCSLGGWPPLQPSLNAPENWREEGREPRRPAERTALRSAGVGHRSLARSTGPGATAFLRGRWCLTAVKLGPFSRVPYQARARTAPSHTPARSCTCMEPARPPLARPMAPRGPGGACHR